MKTLSEKLKDLVGSDAIVGKAELEEMLLQAVTAEKIMNARTLHVASNGKSPMSWSFERWVSILTLVCISIGGIWFAGGRWSVMESSVTEFKQTRDAMAMMTTELTRLRSDVTKRDELMDKRLDELTATIARVAQEAGNAARDARNTAWTLSGRGRGGGN